MDNVFDRRISRQITKACLEQFVEVSDRLNSIIGASRSVGLGIFHKIITFGPATFMERTKGPNHVSVIMAGI